ncbi:MAG: hypothetical protein ABR912_14150 [Terracidiphilus sp.]|jgi:hypothetical protein
MNEVTQPIRTRIGVLQGRHIACDQSHRLFGQSTFRIIEDVLDFIAVLEDAALVNVSANKKKLCDNRR